ALHRLERDPAIALEQLAWPHRQAGIVEALVVEVTVHAIQPAGDPAAARFQERDTDLRMPVAHAAPDHAHAHQHHFHGVGDDVACTAFFEPVHPHLRHAAAGAFMETDGHVQFFHHGPELFVVRMMDHLAVV